MKYEDFMNALATDADLKRKFQTKLEEATPSDAEAAWKASSDAARELGFDVDAGEFALAQRSAQPLSDEELAAVSGGGRASCDWDYICNLSWNFCILSNDCCEVETCDGNISCEASNYIKQGCHTYYLYDGIPQYCVDRANNYQ